MRRKKKEFSDEHASPCGMRRTAGLLQMEMTMLIVYAIVIIIANCIYVTDPSLSYKIIK